MHNYEDYDYNLIKRHKIKKIEVPKFIIKTKLQKKNKKKIMKNLTKSRIQNRKNKFIDKIEYEIELCICSKMRNWDIIDCYKCKLDNDTHKIELYELKSIFDKMMKKVQYDSIDIIKLHIINFFCKIIPLFFKIRIYGDAVMTTLSNICCDSIDMLIGDHYEFKKFIYMMIKIIEKYDQTESSCIIFKNNYYSREKITKKIKNVCFYEGYISKIFYGSPTCIFKICNVVLKINIKNVSRLDIKDLYHDIYESNLIIGKLNESYSLDNAQRIGFVNKVFCTVYPFEDNNQFNIIKKNLINKKLTVLRNVRIKFVDNEIIDIIEGELIDLKYYYEKINCGYTIVNEFPIVANLMFNFTFEKFDNIVHIETNMNSNVIYCVYEFLKINKNDICTYCNKSFDFDIDTIESKQPMLIIPACDCGKKINTSVCDTENETETDQLYIEKGFDYYCGKNKNLNNTFHIECFQQIAKYNVFNDKKNKKSTCIDCEKEIYINEY